MRLFTALWPPADAIAALLADVGPGPAPPGWRAADPQTWHLTLAFHGEAEPDVLAGLLDRRAPGAVPPRLRLAGAGAFPGVRWVGVEADPAGGLAGIAAAAGGDAAGFVPHVTVLRRRRLRRSGRAGPRADPDPPWSAHRGPWWRPPEALLVASEPTRDGPRYRVVHRVPLAPG